MSENPPERPDRLPDQEDGVDTQQLTKVAGADTVDISGGKTLVNRPEATEAGFAAEIGVEPESRVDQAAMGPGNKKGPELVKAVRAYQAVLGEKGSGEKTVDPRTNDPEIPFDATTAMKPVDPDQS